METQIRTMFAVTGASGRLKLPPLGVELLALFFTGGLNLQIEHHLFPGVAHNCYPAIAQIVKEECKKRGIRYVGFDTLPGIALELARFLYVMGKPVAASTGPDAPLLKS